MDLIGGEKKDYGTSDLNPLRNILINPETPYSESGFILSSTANTFISKLYCWS